MTNPLLHRFFTIHYVSLQETSGPNYPDLQEQSNASGHGLICTGKLTHGLYSLEIPHRDTRCMGGCPWFPEELSGCAPCCDSGRSPLLLLDSSSVSSPSCSAFGRRRLTSCRESPPLTEESPSSLEFGNALLDREMLEMPAEVPAGKKTVWRKLDQEWRIGII